MGNEFKKAGVMGWPVEHSLSPRLHGYWLKKYGIKGGYEALAVDPQNLTKSLKGLNNKRFSGVNLTVPHKEAALAVMDSIDAVAKRIGAVNTVIVHADGKLEGRNTDAFGFTQNLVAVGFHANQKPVVVLGAGGAARAAVTALMDVGCGEIRIVNRTRERAEELAKDFGGSIRIFSWGDPAALKDAALLANATSLGLKGQPPLEISLDTLPKDALVTDMVYAPLETDLLKRAEARGNKTVDGLGMLLHQARPAFRAFFGVDPEVTDDLRRHVLGGS
jgi:shikimate dehydrogenase